MNIFLDRNKTLLPRIDAIYLITRFVVLFSIGYYAIYKDLFVQESLIFYSVFGTFSVLLILFYLGTKNKFDIKLAYLSSVIYDLILIPLFILHTGLVNSSFYLLFFITVSVAAVALKNWYSLSMTILVTVGFMAVLYSEIKIDDLFNVGLKIGFLWVYYWAIMYASEHMRKSEVRLLNLLNTLNMRTSELEKSQALLELIYENTRVLASILDPDSIVKEITRLMNYFLNYDSCSIILSDKQNNFYYRARLLNGKSNFHPKAIDDINLKLFRKIADQQEEVLIKDITTRNDFVPLNEQSKSIMIVPMVAHSTTNGILTAESSHSGQFKDKDLQILTAIARSGALALENAFLHKKTAELTIRDELTKAYNYRYFVQKLEEEKRRTARYNLPLSLIMVDIDWFKKLNDSYGHEAGNKVLERLSSIIKNCTRDVDIFARYGGEEFAIILPQTPLSEAKVISERIRKRVEQETFETNEGRKMRITVSIGLTSFPENGKSEEEIIAIADQAMYHAKGEGRNKVCII
jgi:diguanylate cyclase (GGDEF)-like protein